MRLQYVLLSTALLAINDSQGNEHLAMALLDSGYQSSFITRRLCDKLGLKSNRVNLTVSGIGSVTSNVTHRCNTTVKSRDGTNKPKLQKTAFGWVVSGPMNVNGRQNTVNCNLSTKFELHDQLTRFWEIEESSSKKLMSNEEIVWEAHFSETFRRNNEGRHNFLRNGFKYSVDFLKCSLMDEKVPSISSFIYDLRYGSSVVLGYSVLVRISEHMYKRKAANIIRSDFYVDDLLSGADTREEAIELCKQISECLQGGCFNLRKSRSNDPSILQNVQSQTNETALDFGTQSNSKTLGLRRSCANDPLMYLIQTDSDKPTTIRTILSCISQIFDPLGLLRPCVIIAKVIIQDLWLAKLGWDDPLPKSCLVSFYR
ncbi:hypothetical protein NQ318_012895 [Aromia moschata]|uniref:Peptidase aspartic putative domain-containing protein n=1 Tax=Aromia moschata TaxID=1265417 RepID=A0AAV8YC26_9CUCU|nr:hypothetical protein NQ318_012895 [Aromia moschata]